MQSKAVIGLGFGDEGKGITTDYLCSRSLKPLVIRFSGGQQCGHTVVFDDIKHVFSNFGSGTLRGVPTYWAKYCTVDPIGLTNELDILLEKGVYPSLFIDERCPVTTPYDMFSNQLNEECNQHGSCGVGVGTTINREENHYSLTFGDLFYPQILNIKLDAIKKYYGFNKTISLQRFYDAINVILTSDYIKPIFDLPQKYHYSDFIFEGSQGLLLDPSIGFFPNVTRSNTGTKNIIDLGFKPELFLVTRAYQTRHGNGKMTNELTPHNISIDPNETNVYNKYQGEFRRSLLDLDLLLYGMSKDEYIRNCTNKTLVITCLDHILNEYRFTYQNQLVHCLNQNQFIKRVSNILNIGDVIISNTNQSENMFYKYMLTI